jgi:hypothetical protein
MTDINKMVKKISIVERTSAIINEKWFNDAKMERIAKMICPDDT